MRTAEDERIVKECALLGAHDHAHGIDRSNEEIMRVAKLAAALPRAPDGSMSTDDAQRLVIIRATALLLVAERIEEHAKRYAARIGGVLVGAPETNAYLNGLRDGAKIARGEKVNLPSRD